MYYNPDLVAEPPATIEDLTAACDGLASDISCLVVPGGNDAGDAYHHQMFITSFGGQLFGYTEGAGYDGSTVLINSDETVAGATLLQELIADGYVPSTNYGDAKNLFTQGEAAFWFTGPWEVGSLNTPADNPGAPNWAVATMPTVSGNPMAPHVGIQGFYQSAFAQNAAIASAFLLDFIATEEVMTGLYNADPRGSAFKATIAQIEVDPVACRTSPRWAASGARSATTSCCSATVRSTPQRPWQPHRNRWKLRSAEADLAPSFTRRLRHGEGLRALPCRVRSQSARPDERI